MPNHCGRAAQEMLVWHLIFHHKNTALAILRDHLKLRIYSVVIFCLTEKFHGAD